MKTYWKDCLPSLNLLCGGLDAEETELIIQYATGCLVEKGYFGDLRKIVAEAFRGVWDCFQDFTDELAYETIVQNIKREGMEWEQPGHDFDYETFAAEQSYNYLVCDTANDQVNIFYLRGINDSI